MARSIASGGMLSIEPGEDWDLTWSYAGKLPVGAAITSVQLFASQMAPMGSTTLAAGGAVAAATLSLVANVGEGALLMLEDGTPNREVVKVFSIIGNGPYTATIVPNLRRSHAIGSPVTYEPGVSSMLLEATNATVQEDEEAVISHISGMVEGYRYRVSCRIETDGDRHLEDAFIMVVRES